MKIDFKPDKDEVEVTEDCGCHYKISGIYDINTIVIRFNKDIPDDVCSLHKLKSGFYITSNMLREKEKLFEYMRTKYCPNLEAELFRQI
jgi:hypothetical protein